MYLEMRSIDLLCMKKPVDTHPAFPYHSYLTSKTTINGNQMIESVKVHFMKESGYSFAEISAIMGIQIKDVPGLYVKALSAKKNYGKEKSKDPVVYRKRINLGNKPKISSESIRMFKQSYGEV